MEAAAPENSPPTVNSQPRLFNTINKSDFLPPAPASLIRSKRKVSGKMPRELITTEFYFACGRGKEAMNIHALIILTL